MMAEAEVGRRQGPGAVLALAASVLAAILAAGVAPALVFLAAVFAALAVVAGGMLPAALRPVPGHVAQLLAGALVWSAVTGLPAASGAVVTALAIAAGHLAAPGRTHRPEAAVGLLLLVASLFHQIA